MTKKEFTDVVSMAKNKRDLLFRLGRKDNGAGVRFLNKLLKEFDVDISAIIKRKTRDVEKSCLFCKILFKSSDGIRGRKCCSVGCATKYAHTFVDTKKLSEKKYDRIYLYIGGNDTSNASIKLETTLSNIQKMVDYTNKQINVNFISNYDITPIQVLANLNLSNVNLLQNGSIFVSGSSGSSGTSSYISSGNTFIAVNSTSNINQIAIEFNTGNSTSMTVSEGGVLALDKINSVPLLLPEIAIEIG